MARHRGEFRVRLMCCVRGVSVSGCYAAARRAPSQRAVAGLQDVGIPCSRKRVAYLMRAARVRAKRTRRSCRTNTSDHAHPIVPNTIARGFDIRAIGHVNRVWSADIMYLPTGEGRLYLGTVMDLVSRRIIGWATSLATSALTMALAQRRTGDTARPRAQQALLLYRADWGSQYASTEYRRLFARHGMACSMSHKGNCRDNAVAEGFFATLKTELVHDADWQTRDEARVALVEYIEGWYNRMRRHSTLGYKSPVPYELENMQMHVQDVKAA